MMVTQHRRRQWRDKRKPPSDFVSDLKIGLHVALTMFFLGMLLIVVFIGQPAVNAFLGN
jgi:hypothetical protein